MNTTGVSQYAFGGSGCGVQKAHTVDGAVMYCPSGHRWQIKTPLIVYSARPRLHTMGHVALVAGVVHAAYDPLSGALFAHELQEACATPSVYVPAGQYEHALAAAYCWPFGW